uniref:NonSMC condensin II complex, subunit D3 [Callithrix jacchus] n=1 Tax=Lepeophtheirus salmonis TaxID=72036 RepID=A0A0K2TBV8_LEPSM
MIESPHFEDGGEDDDEGLQLIVNCLKCLYLDELPIEWVDHVWDSQFTEVNELPFSYTNRMNYENLNHILGKTTAYITEWVKNYKERPSISTSFNDTRSYGVSSIWATLVAQNIKYKSLIALLYYLMHQGQNLSASEEDRDLCIESSSLYFLLLSLPGSGAFKVFHAVLYCKTLNTFKLALKLHLIRSSPKKKSSSQAKKKSSQQRWGGSLYSGGTNYDSDGSDDEMTELLSPDQIRVLTKSLNSVLDNFLFYLSHSSLKRSPESLDLTIAELVDLTHLEITNPNLNFKKPRERHGLSYLAFNAYKGLQTLCSPLHGVSAKISKMILKALLPGVLMVHKGASEVNTKGLSVIREHSILFLHHLIDILEECSYEGVEIFIQHLAFHVPDKAEFRQKASSTIVSITRRLPRIFYNRVVRWFLSWSYNEMMSQRLFAVEVMGAFILVEERSAISHTMKDLSPPAQENNDPQDLISHKFIFGVLLDRCRDSSTKVRAKAFKTLSDITIEAHSDMIEIIRSTFNVDKNDGNNISSRRSNQINFIKVLQDLSNSDLQNMNPIPSAEDIIEFLIISVSDESVFVRKSSLQVMYNIVKISNVFREELVRILAKHCRDPSLMVRKQMISFLTEILRIYPENEIVIHLWVEGIFPIVMDSELKASEKALECIWEMLFENLTDHECVNSQINVLPWQIIHESENLGMTKYLTRASGIWYRDGLLKSSIFKMIRSHINTENNDRAWFLLAVITNHVPLQDPHFVMEYFNASIHTQQGVGLYTLIQVLSVLLSSVSRLSIEEQKNLQKDLVLLIERFSLPTELISTATDIATVVSQLEALRKDGSIDVALYHSNVESWACNVVDLIDKDLQTGLLNNPNDKDFRLIRQIFTLGELSLIVPGKIHKKLFLLLQNLVFNDKKTPGAGPSNISLGGRAGSSSKIAALAIVTLNKMCVTNEEMAKKIVPAYGRLLDESTDSAVKNNIIYGLSDLCVKYANVVESIVPQMVTCLKDKSSLVKQTTLVTIIHLLQEDYLKIGGGRGTFFLRLIQTKLDDEIKSLTEFFIKHRLMKKSPNVMYQHFIEALFFYNEYKGHSTYNKFIDSQNIREMFSIAGASGKESRMYLYKFMLENMNDEQRFQMTYKLCQDILGGTLEGQIKLNDDSYGVLKDALACLASDEIKLVSLKSKSTDEVEDGDEDLAGAVAAVAKKTIISQVVKKNIIENIIPIVIALKHKLEELKHPLIDDLMTYLREIMKDYKDEVKEMISADKRLAHEIQFDLKRWEDQQRRNEARDTEDDSSGEDENDGDFHPEAQRRRIDSREVNDDRLIRQVLKTAIVNFRSRRRTLNDDIEKVDSGVVQSSRRTLTHVDLADRNKDRETVAEVPKNNSAPQLNLNKEQEQSESLCKESDGSERDCASELESNKERPSVELSTSTNKCGEETETSKQPCIPTEKSVVSESSKRVSKETASQSLRSSPESLSFLASTTIASSAPIGVPKLGRAEVRDSSSTGEVFLNPQNAKKRLFNSTGNSIVTPVKRLKINRAISTPSVSVRNITFLNESDCSAISFISAPSPKNVPNSISSKKGEEEDGSIGSFRYGRNKTDAFDHLVDGNKK